MRDRVVLMVGSLLWLVTIPVTLGAVQPEVWRTSGVAGFSQVTRDSVGVSSGGFVELGLGRVESELQATTVWALERDGEGVWVACGDQGNLYRIGSDGDITQEAKVIQPQITALGRDDQGHLWVGTAPDGVLYRWRNQTLEFMADTPEEYIWAIAPHPQGGVMVGTGGEGKLYRVGADHETALMANLEVTHITGMVALGDDWIVTTDSPGRLMRVTSKGTFSVLVEGEEPEFRSPIVRSNGDISFLANDADGSGRLYRFLMVGNTELQLSLDKRSMYSLQVDAEGVLWFAAGGEEGQGALYKVYPGDAHEWVEAVTIPETQATDFVLDDAGPRWLAGGTPGRVYFIPEGNAPAGRVVSKVHDAREPAIWGAISIDPGRSLKGVTVETRSGNAKTPDASWESWEPVSMDAGSGSVPSSSSRYIQWRLNLSYSGTRVREVRVAYLQKNQPPKVQRVLVSGLGAEMQLTPNHMAMPGVFQELPGGLRVEFQKPGTPMIPEAPVANVAWARRYRTVSWDGSDPNKDPLVYELQIHRLDFAGWIQVADELASSPYVWDSSTTPDGWYEMRITASDEASNPPHTVLYGTGLTESFAVDNTPPELRDLAVHNGKVEGSVLDEMSPIRILEFAVDGGLWKQFFPVDGIPDQNRETFSLPLDHLNPGSHVVQIRAVDIAGNVGVEHVAYTKN